MWSDVFFVMVFLICNFRFVLDLRSVWVIFRWLKKYVICKGVIL